MLVLPSEIHHLVDLRFCHFIRENPAYPDALLMDMEHNTRGLFHVHPEEALEYDDDEFHRRIIVVEKQHLVLARLLGLGTRFRGDICLTLTLARIVVTGRGRYRELVVRVRHHGANIVSAGQIASAETSFRGMNNRNSKGLRSHARVRGGSQKTNGPNDNKCHSARLFQPLGKERGERRPTD